MSCAQAAWLPGGRLHLHHGPIDLVISAEGPARAAALRAAAARFDGLLDSLVTELAALRRPLAPGHRFADPVARRMAAAVAPHGDRFVTPMAAVAGAVADTILAAMTAAGPLTRAVVNNGGDVALHLAPGASARAAIVGAAARLEIRAGDGVGGVATSGWRGRSHSLGIADAVSVLAADAATADAAATLVANAVDLPGHPAIRRRPATDLAPDSDLGPRLVTVAVGALSAAEADRALAAGRACAEDFRARGLIAAALLALAGRTAAAGALAAIPAPEPADA